MVTKNDTASNQFSYRDHPAIAQSDLKLYYDNPMAFYQAKILGKPKPVKRTPAMTFGLKVDNWLLDPGSVIEIPPSVLTSDGKRRGKKWDAFSAEREGKQLVTLDEMEIFEQIASFAKEYHPKVYNALFVHEKEHHQQYYWPCPHTGLERKCEIDMWLPEFKMVIDVKTTQEPRSWEEPGFGGEPTLKGFAEIAWSLGYHIQGATYLEGMVFNDKEAESYCIIAIRNEWPYDCEIYELSAEAILDAEQWNKRVMEKLADQIERNDWHPETSENGMKLSRPATYAGRRWDR